MKHTHLLLFLAIALFAQIPRAFAQMSATDIVSRVDEQQRSDSSQTQMEMLIYPNAKRKRDVREFKLISYSEGDEQTYIEFVEPRAITGLRILSSGDNQWIYFPSTGRRRKIASSARGESVRGVGGDFSYEDLGGGSLLEKYIFTIVKENNRTWTLEGIPTGEDSVYSKIVLDIEKESFHVLTTQYYEGDTHTKTLTYKDYKEIGGLETAMRLEMVNHKENSMTVVEIHDAVYDVAIDEKYFNPSRFYR